MKEQQYTTKERQIAYAILNYLMKHPLAQDTVVGIGEWWILREQIDRTLEEVGRALDFLMSKHFIIRKEYNDHEQRFQLNKENLGIIISAMKEMSKEAGLWESQESGEAKEGRSVASAFMIDSH